MSCVAAGQRDLAGEDRLENRRKPLGTYIAAQIADRPGQEGVDDLLAGRAAREDDDSRAGHASGDLTGRLETSAGQLDRHEGDVGTLRRGDGDRPFEVDGLPGDLEAFATEHRPQAG